MRLLADTVVWIRPPMTKHEDYAEQLERHKPCHGVPDDAAVVTCGRCGGPFDRNDHYMAYGRNVCVPCGDLLMTLKVLAG